MKKVGSKVWKWTKRLVVAFFVLSIISTILFRFIPVPVTPLMLIRCVEQVADGKAPKLKKDWIPMKEMSPNLVLAVIEKVAKQNVKLQKRGKPIKGGSTISQQCAKNVFLFPQRSYIRKAFEVYFTFLIEIFWSKKRIMEVYLNVIEMGDGIYGAQAAAKTYFKKDAEKLTASECALIAAVLPNPRKWNAGKPTGFINKRKNWILRQMGHLRGTVQL